jgi:hypothetical protein
MFTDTKVGITLWSCFLVLLKSYNYFDEIDDKDFHKIVTSHIIPFNELVRKYHRKTTVQVNSKSSKVKEVYTGPELPRKSPLYLDCEMSIFDKIAKPVFGSVEHIRSEYHNSILSNGFLAVSEQLENIYQKRWLIVQLFARSTTRRLQEIRKISGNSGLRKSQVTAEQVKGYLQAEHDPVEALNRFIVGIITSVGISPDTISGEIYNIYNGQYSLDDAVRNDIALAYIREMQDLKIPDSHFKKLEIASGRHTELLDTYRAYQVILNHSGAMTLLGTKATVLARIPDMVANSRRFVESVNHFRKLKESILNREKETIMAISEAYYLNRYHIRDSLSSIEENVIALAERVILPLSVVDKHNVSNELMLSVERAKTDILKISRSNKD